MTRNPPRTMLIVRDFQPDDLLRLQIQEHQLSATEMVEDGEAEWMQNGGPCFTALRPDGSALACIGLIHQWEGRALAWALLSKDLGRDMLPLTRAVSTWLKHHCEYRRVEAYVDPAFLEGRRWAHLLGFKLETPEPMAGFYPNGNAAYLYARVRHG